MKNHFKQVDQLIKKQEYNEALEQLNKLNRQYPDNVEILLKRAGLLYKLQKYTDALNDYNQSVNKGVKNTEEVKAKIEIITNIIKYQGADIYASTNLHNDPWLDE